MQTAKAKAPAGAEFFQDVSDFAQEEFERHGIGRDAAIEASQTLCRRVLDVWAGISVYIARNSLLDVQRRRDAVAQEFDGTNVTELARKHRVSEVFVYRMIKLARQGEREQRLTDAANPTEGAASKPEEKTWPFPTSLLGGKAPSGAADKDAQNPTHPGE
jgi:Mor family transcriptional regulator